jgi:hypothetical protein
MFKMGYPDYDRQQFMSCIEWVDSVLDANVADEYKSQPLAQDWARISKGIEESGEAISAYIGMTGQNPRKGISDTREHFYEEMADAALTFIYGLQHFTKDAKETWRILSERAETHFKRLPL